MMAIATWEHAKELRYCSSGLRRWCEARSIAHLDLIRDGVDTQWLRAQGDAMADKLADYAERQAMERERNGR